jgi:hypothetical protein
MTNFQKLEEEAKKRVLDEVAALLVTNQLKFVTEPVQPNKTDS